MTVGPSAPRAATTAGFELLGRPHAHAADAESAGDRGQVMGGDVGAEVGIPDSSIESRISP